MCVCVCVCVCVFVCVCAMSACGCEELTMRTDAVKMMMVVMMMMISVADVVIFISQVITKPNGGHQCLCELIKKGVL